MYNANKKFRKGFGIIEVLIASTIIVVILLALTAIGRQSLRNAVHLHERAQALYLAQQGLELIRQSRDTNWIDGANGTNWDTFVRLGSTIGSPDPYIATSNQCYYLNTSSFSITGYNNRYFLMDGGTTCGSRYETFTVDNVAYRRYMKFERVSIQAGANADWKVTVSIGWDSEVPDSALSLSEIITNWRPNY